MHTRMLRTIFLSLLGIGLLSVVLLQGTAQAAQALAPTAAPKIAAPQPEGSVHELPADHYLVRQARSWEAPLLAAHRYAGPLLFARPRGGAWYVDEHYDPTRPGQTQLKRGDRLASIFDEAFPPAERSSWRNEARWPIQFTSRPGQATAESVAAKNYFLSERERRRLAMRLSSEQGQIKNKVYFYLRAWTTYTHDDESLLLQLLREGAKQNDHQRLVLDLRGGIGRPSPRLSQALAAWQQVVVLTDQMTGGQYGDWLAQLKSQWSNQNFWVIGQPVPHSWPPAMAKPTANGRWQLWRQAPSKAGVSPHETLSSDGLMYAAGRDQARDRAEQRLLAH